MQKTVLARTDGQRTISIARNLVHAHKQDVLPYQNLSLQNFFNLVKNLPYDAHEYHIGEVIKRPAITLSEGGDCEDKAILMVAFLLSFPHKVIFTFTQFFITADYGKGDEHIFNGLRCHKGKWFYIDATYSKNEIGKVYNHPIKLTFHEV